MTREAMHLSAAQLHTLRHMLGINTPETRLPQPYRNYAAVTPGDAEYLELERLGAVERYECRMPDSSYHWYRCTDAGKLAAIRSHRDIRYSKAKRRYIKYLEVSDAFSELTFMEFLTRPEFAETRANA